MIIGTAPRSLSLASQSFLVLLGERETSNAACTVAVGGGRRRPVGDRSGNVGQYACPALVSTSIHDLPCAEHLRTFFVRFDLSFSLMQSSGGVHTRTHRRTINGVSRA